MINWCIVAYHRNVSDIDIVLKEGLRCIVSCRKRHIAWIELFEK